MADGNDVTPLDSGMPLGYIVGLPTNLCGGDHVGAHRASSSSLTSEVCECERVRTHLTLAGGRAGGEGFNNSVIRDSDDKWRKAKSFGFELYIEHSLESLILAQDERWRRA